MEMGLLIVKLVKSVLKSFFLPVTLKMIKSKRVLRIVNMQDSQRAKNIYSIENHDINVLKIII